MDLRIFIQDQNTGDEGFYAKNRDGWEIDGIQTLTVSPGDCRAMLSGTLRRMFVGTWDVLEPLCRLAVQEENGWMPVFLICGHFPRDVESGKQFIREAREKQLTAEREKRAVIFKAEGEKQAAITIAEGEKEAAILRADAIKQQRILEAEGEAQAILAVQQAEADAIRLLNESDPDGKVISLRSLDTLAKVANGKATKIIIPSELQNLGAVVPAIKELLTDPAGADADAPQQ